MSREQGERCSHPINPSMACNAIVAAWAKGSEVRFVATKPERYICIQ